MAGNKWLCAFAVLVVAGITATTLFFTGVFDSANGASATGARTYDPLTDQECEDIRFNQTSRMVAIQESFLEFECAMKMEVLLSSDRDKVTDHGLLEQELVDSMQKSLLPHIAGCTEDKGRRHLIHTSVDKNRALNSLDDNYDYIVHNAFVRMEQDMLQNVTCATQSAESSYCAQIEAILVFTLKEPVPSSKLLSWMLNRVDGETLLELLDLPSPFKGVRIIEISSSVDDETIIASPAPRQSSQQPSEAPSNMPSAIIPLPTPNPPTPTPNPSPTATGQPSSSPSSSQNNALIVLGLAEELLITSCTPEVITVQGNRSTDLFVDSYLLAFGLESTNNVTACGGCFPLFRKITGILEEAPSGERKFQTAFATYGEIFDGEEISDEDPDLEAVELEPIYGCSHSLTGIDRRNLAKKRDLQGAQTQSLEELPRTCKDWDVTDGWRCSYSNCFDTREGSCFCQDCQKEICLEVFGRPASGYPHPKADELCCWRNRCYSSTVDKSRCDARLRIGESGLSINVEACFTLQSMIDANAMSTLLERAKVPLKVARNFNLAVALQCPLFMAAFTAALTSETRYKRLQQKQQEYEKSQFCIPDTLEPTVSERPSPSPEPPRVSASPTFEYENPDYTFTPFETDPPTPKPSSPPSENLSPQPSATSSDSPSPSFGQSASPSKSPSTSPSHSPSLRPSTVPSVSPTISMIPTATEVVERFEPMCACEYKGGFIDPKDGICKVVPQPETIGSGNCLDASGNRYDVVFGFRYDPWDGEGCVKFCLQHYGMDLFRGCQLPPAGSTCNCGGRMDGLDYFPCLYDDGKKHAYDMEPLKSIPISDCIEGVPETAFSGNGFVQASDNANTDTCFKVTPAQDCVDRLVDKCFTGKMIDEFGTCSYDPIECEKETEMCDPVDGLCKERPRFQLKGAACLPESRVPNVSNSYSYAYFEVDDYIYTVEACADFCLQWDNSFLVALYFADGSRCGCYYDNGMFPSGVYPLLEEIGEELGERKVERIFDYLTGTGQPRCTSATFMWSVSSGRYCFALDRRAPPSAPLFWTNQFIW